MYMLIEGDRSLTAATMLAKSSPSTGTVDWLFKAHTTRCSALEEAVTQRFVVKDDQFVVQTLRDAYEDLRQSKDPAVQYYIRTLTYLPEGSQRLNPDAVPEIEWRNHDQTSGTVVTPAGTCLGIVEKYADGGWGIIPSENGPMKVIETSQSFEEMPKPTWSIVSLSRSRSRSMASPSSCAWSAIETSSPELHGPLKQAHP